MFSFNYLLLINNFIKKKPTLELVLTRIQTLSVNLLRVCIRVKIPYFHKKP